MEVECEGGSEDDEVEAMTLEDADVLATECEIESERIKAKYGRGGAPGLCTYLRIGSNLEIL